MFWIWARDSREVGVRAEKTSVQSGRGWSMRDPSDHFGVLSFSATKFRCKGYFYWNIRGDRYREKHITTYQQHQLASEAIIPR